MNTRMTNESNGPAPMAGFGSLYTPGDDDQTPNLNLTGPELGNTMDRDLTRINSTAAALVRVRQQVENTRNGLTDDDFAAANPALWDELRKAERQAEDAAKVAQANCRMVLNQTERAPMVLTPGEMQAAETRRGFAERECQTASLTQLRDSVRHAILTNDRAAMYCYAIFAPDRLAKAPDGGSWGDTDPRVRSELQTMVSAIKGKLRDASLTAIHDRAKTQNGRAIRAEYAATNRRRGPFAFETPNDVAW